MTHEPEDGGVACCAPERSNRSGVAGVAMNGSPANEAISRVSVQNAKVRTGIGLIKLIGIGRRLKMTKKKAADPMRFRARRFEHARHVAVQRSRDANARMRRRTATLVRDFAVPDKSSDFAKYLLTPSPNQKYNPSHPVPPQGRIRTSETRGRERWTRQRQA